MRPGVTSAVLVIVIVCLAAVDRFLAAVESAEVKNAAARSYLSGSRLLEQGKTNEAIDFLRDGHALERQNPAYELQLITALTTAGKIAEAEPLMTDILQRAPNDGRANLSAARLMIRKGNTAEAEAYYHRAIYGEWSRDPLLHRVPVRLELIDLLLQKNKKPELLPELISLEAESPPDGPIQKRLAELFLLAGSPSRAANVYANIVEKNPKDISAYEGLGEAELEEGQYRAAHTAFLRASLLDPDNASVREHLQTLNMVTELDPTLRQLTSAGKYNRSIRILEMTRRLIDQCIAKSSSGSSVLNANENRQLLKTADATLGGKTPAQVTNELAEGVLSLAERLWRLDTVACGVASPNENALDLIMRKLAS
jgi:tetratricopeptide (TPR) repeat protein